MCSAKTSERIPRKYRITLDHLSGMTIAAAAEKYEISPGRVHQIVVNVLQMHRITARSTAEQIAILCGNLRHRDYPRPNNDTPEGLYWNELYYNQLAGHWSDGGTMTIYPEG